MSAPLFSIKTGWLVLPAVGLGLAAGFLLRPDRDLGFVPARPDENSLARLANSSPLGRPRGLPQTEARLEALRKAGPPSQQIATALAFAEITSVEEIRDLLENSHRFPSHSAEEVAIGTLLKRWLELDVAGAVEYCWQKKGKFLPKLLANWGQDHPAEASAWVQAMPPGEMQKTSWLSLCTAATTRDPDKAWEMLGRTPGLVLHTESWRLRSEIKAIVARDVEKAIASLETMPPALVASAQTAIAEQLMKTDPARALEWARQHHGDTGILAAAIGGALRYQPTKAMDYLNALPDNDIMEVIDQLPEGAFTKNSNAFAASLLEDTRLMGASKKWLVAKFFNETFYSHPAAAEAILPILVKKLGSRTIAGGMDNFFADNPQEAKSWLENLPEGPLRTAALEAQTNFSPGEKEPIRPGPESLADAIKRNAYIEESNPGLDSVTVEQLREIIAGTQADENYYRQTELLIKIGTVNPSVATAWLESTVIDSKTGPLAAQFSARWAETDPAAAGVWVSKLPAGNLAVNAAANVASQYHRYAPEQAAAWAAQLPPGPVQDAARKAMSGN